MSQKDSQGSLAEMIDSLIEKNIPSVSHGMTVLVSKGSRTLYFNTKGSIKKLGFNYSNDTIYDLASLTKPLATSTLMFHLLDRGRLSLEDSLSSFPVFDGFENIQKLTVRSLMTHTSGLVPTVALYENGKDRPSYLKGIDAAASKAVQGKEEVYSDLNYMLLGFIVEGETGMHLDKAWKKFIAGPNGLKDFTFLPDQPKERIAPAEFGQDRGDVWGEVHDENSFFLGGVAGHAGLFGKAESIDRFLDLYTRGSIISKSSLKKATSPANLYLGGTWGCGWMINVVRPPNPSPAFDYARFLGDTAPYGSFGHTGFTGTSICVEPVSGIRCIILTNRVYPTRENVNILRFRRILHNAVFSSLLMD